MFNFHPGFADPNDPNQIRDPAQRQAMIHKQQQPPDQATALLHALLGQQDEPQQPHHGLYGGAANVMGSGGGNPFFIPMF